MIRFIGAGPGDVDLITIKGRRFLEQADIVIYAGSLVWDEHLKFCKETCEKHNSAHMTLERVIEVMLKGASEGKSIVRLHTGDPSIYGAIREQMDMLDKYNLEYEIIPGVSSFTASCAAIKKEFTLPEVSQTVIITRLEGRTTVPENEDLELLARHKCSMAIFLSVQDIEGVVQKLISGYESDEVPVAVVYKATWPEQKIIFGKLNNIASKVKEEGIKNFSQILVGYFIDGDYKRSMLYNPEFTHAFREGNK